ncbi:CPBP family intramembrane glutamic endopeptidase [Curtobacterium sp. VKM Ac-1393]|uniref:CPBP family intramembrane glutamic endopeptidase n=1 Tax=Curtobacterium sp. VKM Ac-1393 TaxID=2783814 RepID=UPI00188DB061|nr:CPBP family intramembrane glutamic endopeptidase [Curtobacterium sp. VKM Ac-1393]MBF4607812.1 CPBP family intramembrane metalloprotease [Curtobacterium sp. VKM Ac-1393]
MSESSTTTALSGAGGQRFGRTVERQDGQDGQDGQDFPYYDGDPIPLPVWQWVLVIVACAAGFVTLSFFPAANNVQSLVPRFLFTAIPLAVFIVFTRRHWSRIFRRVTGRDVRDIVLFGVANLIVSSVMGLIVSVVFGANANAATDNVEGAGEILSFYLGTAIQLLGEELFTILPFLAVMSFCIRGGATRNRAVVIAWLVTAVWFGAAHLPTYGWNVAQAFLVIGVARLVLTLAYIRTKNIAVSTGAHILNDWVLFTVAILTAGAAAAA